MHDDGAMIRGRNARKRALLRSGVSITLSRLSDSTIGLRDFKRCINLCSLTSKILGLAKSKSETL